MTHEQQLVAKAQRGDRDSLHALISAYWQSVYRLVLSKRGNIEDSQELTQEAFFQALRTFGNHQIKETPFATYLGRIALNLVTDYWKQKGHLPPVISIAEYNEPLVREEAHRQVTAWEVKQQAEVLRLIRLLPHQQRQAIELMIIAGLPVKEGIAMVGKSDSPMNILRQQALQTMSRLLEERGTAGLFDHNLAEIIRASAANQLPPKTLVAAIVDELGAEPVHPSLLRRWKVTALTGLVAAFLAMAAYLGGSHIPSPAAGKQTTLQPPMNIVAEKAVSGQATITGGQTAAELRQIPAR